MPCYLFTYHAYRSWMPDRAQGYVRRHEGILPPDPAMAARYRRDAAYEEIWFKAQHQEQVVTTIETAVTHIQCRLHFVSTDAAHIHALVSWQGTRTWLQNRTSLKRSVTLVLKEKFDDRPWLSDGASRKWVRDAAHFEYLVNEYLPKHDGWKWREGRGLFKQTPATRRSPAIILARIQ
jgi:REP element-mobilizing transposase RayT